MRRLLFLFTLSLLLSACSADSPAPVISLSTEQPVAPIINYDPIRGTRYRVVRGDTLYSIAFRTGMDYRDLAHINHIPHPYTIYSGQIIKLSSPSATVAKVKRQGQSKNSKKTIAKPKSDKYIREHGVNNNVASQASSQELHWQWPTKGPVLLGFSDDEKGNKGLDIGGNRGDSVVASAPGKVVYAGSALRGYGKLIIIKHNDEYISAYAHNEKLLVKEQQWVKAGQLIALKGDSGTIGVKLHFEIRRRGEAINPLQKLPKRG
ncbi:peptidoglycan DD-metalloendopeptidase family protein [Gallaecimonas mangrovi]|uniref:peptidoglycan DD-metalloendopeptidase family protein n=1 Tax=Gallaecimonas mangrovi TaxID=2291597 RepID=UPI000E200FB7|nr:peptidoglycan DD-metalloendopeptidase family protein [Gallaecimonas mangrovi]